VTVEERPEGDSERAQFDGTLRRRIVRSSAWVGLGFGGGQVLTLAATLVLVRLLDPKAFGIVAAGMVLLTVVTQIQESGLGAALVHGRDRDPAVAAGTVLVYASLSSLVLFAAVFLLAPIYARIVDLPDATSIVRGLAVILVIRGLAVAPGAILERTLDYRSRTVAELSGFFVQASVAIGCALGGLGAWSLVAGQIAGSATQATLYWARVPWRPSPRRASIPMLREMLGYGRFVTGANLLNIVNSTIDNVFVGRYLGAAALGFYSIAWRLAGLPTTVIGIVVGRVMFSVYSSLQHDLAAVRSAYLENMQRTLLLALPATALLGIAAEPLVLGLLGEDWLEVVDPLRLLSIFGLQRLVAGPSGELFKGIGRPGLAMMAGLLYLGLLVPSLVVLTPRLELDGAALAVVFAGLATGTVVMLLTFRAITLRPMAFARAIVRPTLPGAAVAASLLVATPVASSLGPFAGLVLVVGVAAVAFLASAALVARPVVDPIWAALRGKAAAGL
jgi:O-antigen/teichoic acid export membrane protein